jgi:hypothetical protein
MFQIFEPQKRGWSCAYLPIAFYNTFRVKKCQCSYTTTVDDVQVSQSIDLCAAESWHTDTNLKWRATVETPSCKLCKTGAKKAYATGSAFHVSNIRTTKTGMHECISANNILQYFPCQKCQCSYATTVDDVQVSQSIYVQQSWHTDVWSHAMHNSTFIHVYLDTRKIWYSKISLAVSIYFLLILIIDTIYFL